MPAPQLFGRMDGDELATPGYAVLSPAVKTKLATLEKGQLMVRHPHFTQPVFVRFPRPAVLSGREGADRFPRSAEPPLEVAVTRSLRLLDPSVTLEWVKQVTGLYEPHEILRAKSQTELARPGDVRGFFKAQFRAVVPARAVARVTRPSGDPFGARGRPVRVNGRGDGLGCSCCRVAPLREKRDLRLPNRAPYGSRTAPTALDDWPL